MTMRIVERAINTSISHNATVTIGKWECAQEHVSVGSVRNELAAECEGSALRADFGVEEFWGSNGEDDGEWRVHVEFR